jgi:hypothetical protein
MKAVNTSETSVNFYETLRRNIPEDSRHYYQDDQIKEAGMGGACSTNRSDEKCLHNFNLNVNHSLGDLIVDERVVLMLIL